jgi:LemA protein
VLARAEAYPELKASTNFLDLQHQLTDTEDRIAAARRFYNLNVGAFNTRVETVPSNVVARLFHFEARQFFELTDPTARLAPHVQP